jgi:transcriptional regulator of aromatic amino acid metabolism
MLEYRSLLNQSINRELKDILRNDDTNILTKRIYLQYRKNRKLKTRLNTMELS